MLLPWSEMAKADRSLVIYLGLQSSDFWPPRFPGTSTPQGRGQLGGGGCSQLDV